MATLSTNAPKRSIAHHHAELAQSVVQSKEKRVGPDGMYESHFVVMASRPKAYHGCIDNKYCSTAQFSTASYGRPPSRLILDATKGVLVLSSSLILLPFRLMSLAFGLWGHHDRRLRSTSENSTCSRLSREVAVEPMMYCGYPIHPLQTWGVCLLLLLVHNYRAAQRRMNGNDSRSQSISKRATTAW